MGLWAGTTTDIIWWSWRCAYLTDQQLYSWACSQEKLLSMCSYPHSETKKTNNLTVKQQWNRYMNTAVKMNELHLLAVTWMVSGTLWLSGNSKLQNDNYSMIPFVQSSKTWKTNLYIVWETNICGQIENKAMIDINSGQQLPWGKRRRMLLERGSQGTLKITEMFNLGVG